MITNTEKNPRPEWLLGGSPISIEAQEAEGQRELVSGTQLPVDVAPSHLNYEKAYELLGIKIIGPSYNDPIFLDCKLPTGWYIQPNDHSMWSKLVDDKNRNRAAIFYKAAFYDRSARIRVLNRYVVTNERIKGDPKADITIGWYYCVKDEGTGENVFQTEVYNGYSNDNLQHQAKSWLKEHYPDHENIAAYW